MALRPGLVFAEVVGSVFCPLTLSRRLHCLLYRRSRPTPAHRAHAAQPGATVAGETGFLTRAIASDATRGVARKRIGRRAIRVATAKQRTPRPSATPRREMRFPRRRAGSRKGSLSHRWAVHHGLAKCEAEPLPRRRAGSRQEACLTGGRYACCANRGAERHRCFRTATQPRGKNSSSSDLRGDQNVRHPHPNRCFCKGTMLPSSAYARRDTYEVTAWQAV